MSTDRELLEAAAKAAGLVIKRSRLDDPMQGDMLIVAPQPDKHNCAFRGWNPLTDDGDALRLAVQIGPLEFSISEYGTAARRPKGEWFGCEAHLHGGKQAATRRAIVRAAASMAPQERAE